MRSSFDAAFPPSEFEAASNDVLFAHHCLEFVDRVPGDPETTAFKRRARLHQALWREARGFASGTQPIRPSKKYPEPRDLGSRIAVEAARSTGANFLNDTVRRAVEKRLANPQPHQTLNEDRLYCDLLSSMPMCFNLFAELQKDLDLANRAIHARWPTTPGNVAAVEFEWSPGRQLEGEYLENRSAFDVAFILDLGGGKKGVLGVETKYHEHCKREKIPSGKRIARYKAVVAASGLMSPANVEKVIGSDLQQIWLDHLLASSMPLHASQKWAWAGFALVHPARNPSYARAVERYQSLLSNPSTIQVTSIESLLQAGVLPEATAQAFKERYLW